MRWFSRGRDTSSADERESPQAEAARWRAREELGLLKGDEAAAFERWRAQAENRQAERAASDARSSSNSRDHRPAS